MTMTLVTAFLVSVQARALEKPTAENEAEPAIEAKYAPDRKVDIEHVAIDVTPDFDKRTIHGVVTFSFKPIAKPLDELKLDAVDLTVEKIESSSGNIDSDVTDEQITVFFAKPIAKDAETKLTIRYSAQPKKGLYFRVPSNGYSASDMHVFSQGEMIEARHWFPCYDSPNEKFTSEVTCHVHEGMQVFSNGTQISSVKEPASNLVAVRWRQDKPHSTYLISLVAGYFKKTDVVGAAIPLFYATTPSDVGEAQYTFKETKPILDFLQKEIAVDYPWAQYGQVVVHDFRYSGMENTSLTSLAEKVLHRPDTEDITTQGQYANDEVLAHEMAHQWFGDLVTCKDWSHSWLNEGFATYYALLYMEQSHGHDQLVYEVFTMLHQLMDKGYHAEQDKRPVVFREYMVPVERFDERAYAKGALVLNMLRTELGAELFRQCIKTYLDRHKFQTVVTSDLNAVIEEFSGRSFDRFFDQWIYRPGYPELAVSYSWDGKNKLAKISVRQKQVAKDGSNLYHFPLPIRFKTKGAVIDRTVEVKKATEDFYVPLASPPNIVRLDPHLSLMAKIDFNPPEAMLNQQLKDESDAAGRLIAARQLSETPNDRAIALLKETLSKDKFYGVRVEAAKSLGEIHNEQAMDALIASVSQPDGQARQAVMVAIGKFYHVRAKEALLAAMEKEQNPIVVGDELKGLAVYHDDAVHQQIARALKSSSYQDRITNAAFDAIHMQDDVSYASELRSVLKDNERDLSLDFGAGFDALGYVERNEKDKKEVREFIASYLNDKREGVILGAIRGLGALEDPQAYPLLESYLTDKDMQRRSAAQYALNSIRRAGKPQDNLRDLRNEVLELKKANKEIKKDFDDLKKRFDLMEKASHKKGERSK